MSRINILHVMKGDVIKFSKHSILVDRTTLGRGTICIEGISRSKKSGKDTRVSKWFMVGRLVEVTRL